MADRYWVGGTGTWNISSTTNWRTASGGTTVAAVPTAADNVIFDQAGTYTVTLSGALNCSNFTVSAGTVTFTSTGTPTINGSMSLVSGTVWSGTGLVTFNATTTGKTITTNGTTIGGPITFDGTGGEWTLTSALTTGTTLTTTLSKGTLALGNYTLTTGIFSSSNSNTRSIAFGTGNIVLAHTTAATTVLDMSVATGFTVSGTGGFTATAAITRSYAFGGSGGSSTNAPNLTLTGSGTAVQTFTNNNWWKTLNFGSTVFTPATTTLNIAGTLTLSAGGTFSNLTIVGQGATINSNTNTTLGNLTCTSGVTLSANLTLASNKILTHNSGTINLNGFNLTAGSYAGGTLSVPISATRAITFGSNYIYLTKTTTGIIIDLAAYTEFSCSGIGGFSVAGTIARSYGLGTFIGPTDAQIAAGNVPNLFITSGSAIQSLGFSTSYQIGYYGTINFTGYSGTPAISTVFLTGLIIGNTGVFTNLSFNIHGTGNLNTGTSGLCPGLTIGTTAAAAGTTTLTGACTFVNAGSITHGAGTLNLNGFNLTCGNGSNLGVYSLTGTSTRSIIFGINNIICQGLSAATATNFSITGTTTGGFQIPATSSQINAFGTTGGTTTNAPNLTFTTGAWGGGSITTGSWFNKLTFNSGVTGSIGTTTINVNIAELCSTGTFTGLTISTRGTGTITSNGQTVAGFTVNGSGITTTLNDALNITGAFTLTQGTLNISTFSLTSGSWSTSNSNVRSLTGSGTYTITGSVTATTATNLTCTGITISMTSASAKTFAGGGASYPTLNQGGVGILTITGSNTFNDLTATTRPSTIKFTAGTTQTFSNFTLSGTLGNLVTLQSVTSGTAYTLSRPSGTTNVDYLSIQDSTATPAGSWYAGTGSTNVSNNTNWVFNIPGSGALFNFFFF